MLFISVCGVPIDIVCSSCIICVCRRHLIPFRQ